MRTKRTLVTMGLALSVLAGGNITTHGQELDGDHLAPAVVTGEFFGGCPEGDQPVEFLGEATRRSVQFVCQRVEASDPRLSGDNVYVGTWDDYDGFQLEAADWTLTNDGGSWVGANTALIVDDTGGGGEFSMETLTLTGQDGYEGLSAHLYLDWTTDPVTFIGAIFPGEMPPLPSER